MRRRILIPIKNELDSSEQFHFSQSVSVDFDTEEYIGIFITRNGEFDRIGSKMIKAPNASLSIYGSEYIKGMKNFFGENFDPTQDMGSQMYDDFLEWYLDSDNSKFKAFLNIETMDGEIVLDEKREELACYALGSYNEERGFEYIRDLLDDFVYEWFEDEANGKYSYSKRRFVQDEIMDYLNKEIYNNVDALKHRYELFEKEVSVIYKMPNGTFYKLNFTIEFEGGMYRQMQKD